MKKKLVAAIAAVCLVLALGVGATLAYYTSTTDAVKNTFTIGNVKIELLEPTWDPSEGLTLVPGADVKKDPFIVNTGASAGYMMMHVSGADTMPEGFTVKYGDAEGFNSAKWIQVDELGNVVDPQPAKLADGYYVYVGDDEGAVAAGSQTEALFTSVAFDAKEQMTTNYQIIAKYEDKDGYFTFKDVDGNVIEANKDRKPNTDADGNVLLRYFVAGDDCADSTGYATYADAETHVLGKHSESAEYVFDLTVTGYAIQKENVKFQDDNKNYPWVGILTGKVTE